VINFRGKSSSHVDHPFEIKDLFESFYYDQNFLGIWNKYTSKIDEIDVKDAEIYFASGAILGRDVLTLAKKFPEPVSLENFKRLIKQQYAAQLASGEKGIFVQPTEIQKILLVAAIAKSANKKVFIELGTYLGHSVRMISRLFNEIYSVEASRNIYIAASKLFEITNAPINLMHGSSIELLQLIEPQIGDHAVIFLDAHYSTGLTSKDFGVCPLFQELEIVFKKFPKSVCVVDDMRTMDGENGYPKFSEIMNFLPSNTEVVLKHDLMILNLDSTNGLSLIGNLDSILQ